MHGGRAHAGEYARRVNAAAELLASGVPVVEAVRELVARFGCSARQARRYVERAAHDGPTPVPEATTVFTVRLPLGARNSAQVADLLLCRCRRPG